MKIYRLPLTLFLQYPLLLKRNEFYPKNRSSWRRWLDQHHATETHVWLLMYKKDSGRPSVVYAEAVEEALCYGWIDSKPNKRDADSYFLFFAPRKPKSVWSALNKKRIDMLLAQNLIMPAGMAKIEAAKKDGSWSSLDAVEALQMPQPLEKAFKKNKKAAGYFNQFPASVKKGIYQWIASARTDATVSKRVEETVRLAAENIRANQWSPRQQ